VKHWPLSLLSLLLLSTRVEAGIIDGVSIDLGKSASTNCDLTLIRVGVQKNWQKQWFKEGAWHVGGYWDLSLGYWDNQSAEKTNSGILDIGLTPTFRLEQNDPSAVSPYLEAAVGVHFLSHSSVSAHREFGSSFQFGDHVGAGIRFGRNHAYDLSYRFQHLSNAGIKAPNQGINYNQVRFGVHF